MNYAIAYGIKKNRSIKNMHNQPIKCAIIEHRDHLAEAMDRQLTKNSYFCGRLGSDTGVGPQSPFSNIQILR